MRLPLVLALCAVALTGCDWINAATADHPNATQRDAMSDIFTSMGSFISVVSDPATASDDDFVKMHDSAAYEKILDPAKFASAAAITRGGSAHLSPTGCVTGTAGTAAWDCDVTVSGATCHVSGSGQDNGDGTYGGSSQLDCAALSVKVTATNLQFDKVQGQGSGRLRLEVGNPTLAGWADVTLTGIGFCTDQATPAPNSGSMTIDGLGALDGRPFDPLGLEFSNTPACGTVNIK